MTPDNHPLIPLGTLASLVLISLALWALIIWGLISVFA